MAAICGRETPDTPIVIFVDGTITLDNTDHEEAKKAGSSCTTGNNQIRLDKVSHVTILGFGNAKFEQIGISVVQSSNIVFQGLYVSDVKKEPGWPESNGGDAMGFSRATNIWIDHCTIEAFGTENRGYDGLMDMTSGTQNITVSYCALLNSGRGGLMGGSSSDNANSFVTFHHNYYWYVSERLPLLRYGTIHTYNNYVVGISHSGINPRRGGKAKIENNYFYNSFNPFGTFWDSVPGFWDISGNVLDNITWHQWTANDIIPGDNATSTINITIDYDYTLDNASCVPDLVLATAGAGRGFRVSDGACGVEGNPTSPVPSLPDPNTAATPIPYVSDPSLRKPDAFATGTTGGDGGDVQIVESGTAILEAICNRPSRDSPLVLYFEGEATLETTDTANTVGPSCTILPNVISFVNVSNITLHGYNGGELHGIGIHIADASNIIIKRLLIKDVFDTNDASASNSGVAIRTSGKVENVWIDHIAFDGRESDDAAKGLLELSGETSQLTVSYCAFKWDLPSCFVVVKDSSTRIAMHHNQFNDAGNSLGCMVSLESGETHLFNNRIYKSETVGVNVKENAEVLLELNVFEDAVNPFGSINSPVAGKWVLKKNEFKSVTWTSFNSDDVPGGPDMESTGSMTVPYVADMDILPCLAVVLPMAGDGNRDSKFDCYSLVEDLL
eukprot:gene9308-14428_t